MQAFASSSTSRSAAAAMTAAEYVPGELTAHFQSGSTTAPPRATQRAASSSTAKSVFSISCSLKLAP
ncbi:MAG TPA: hypothetical protein DDW78_05105 [Treponema sp.]|nr:hypothetical protein [Treponema sp.]